jgi:hypothetical protein
MTAMTLHKSLCALLALILAVSMRGARRRARQRQ